MKAIHTYIKVSFLFITLFLSFIITIAYSSAFTLTTLNHQTSSLPPQDHACLVFEPASSSVSVGDTFTLTIQIQADSHQVDGVAAYVDFDQSRLHVEQITLSSALPIILEESFSNITGTINLAAGTISNFPTGTFEFAEIELAAQSATPITSLAFNFTPPRQSDITFAGNSIIGCHTDAIIVINIPTVTPSNTPTAFPITATSTPTIEPTHTPTIVPTAHLTQSPTATAHLTQSPTATAHLTQSPTATAQATNSPTATAQGTNSPTAIAQGTNSPTAIAQGTNSPTAIAQATNSPTVTAHLTHSPTATAHLTSSPTATAHLTQSPTVTIQPTNTPTHIATITTQRELFLPIVLKSVE